MPDLDFELLASEAHYLDSDERFFDEAEGSFTWWGFRVFFRKEADWFVLEVEGVELTVARPLKGA